ncbi:unnamed protein product [Amoebophrya sp. A120]|nr:unnamed protein product [Amoebophrya sp. A120]|eukprot:GSA120T00009233001.1
MLPVALFFSLQCSFFPPSPPASANFSTHSVQYDLMLDTYFKETYQYKGEEEFLSDHTNDEKVS